MNQKLSDWEVDIITRILVADTNFYRCKVEENVGKDTLQGFKEAREYTELFLDSRYLLSTFLLEVEEQQTFLLFPNEIYSRNNHAHQDDQPTSQEYE